MPPAIGEMEDRDGRKQLKDTSCLLEAGHRSSISLLLMRWVSAWGYCGGRTEEWASSGRGPLQQEYGFTAVQVICRNVHCELPQCNASVCMWEGGCNLGLPSSLFTLQS